jgi:hypothetical protein
MEYKKTTTDSEQKQEIICGRATGEVGKAKQANLE